MLLLPHIYRNGYQNRDLSSYLVYSIKIISTIFTKCKYMLFKLFLKLAILLVCWLILALLWTDRTPYIIPKFVLVTVNYLGYRYSISEKILNYLVFTLPRKQAFQECRQLSVTHLHVVNKESGLQCPELDL